MSDFLVDLYADDDRLHFVYRVFDANDVLLYVGCTVDVDTRMKGHESTANWFPFHARVERVAYTDRGVAQKAESAAITTEFPRWNINGRSPDHPDGYAKSLRQAHWLAAEADMAQRWRTLRAEREQLEGRLQRNRGEQAVLDAQMDAHPAIVALRQIHPLGVSYRNSSADNRCGCHLDLGCQLHDKAVSA